MVQEALIHQRHLYRRIKISQTIFVKCHPRNIPVKLLQNQTSSSSGEDFKELLKMFHFVAMVLCTYPVLPSSVHVCIYFEWFPLWLFLELDFLLWNIVLEVSGPFYSLITRNYATDFNMNFLEVSLLL